LFGIGYGTDTTNSAIWKIQFQSCKDEIKVEVYFNLTQNGIPLNEEVLAFGAPTIGSCPPNFVVTNTSIYVQVQTKPPFSTCPQNFNYIRNPLPQSQNSSDVYPIITGVFQIGLNEIDNDNIYIGRGRADPRAPGQLLIYSTDDSHTFFHYNRTVELAAAPLNLQIQGFIGNSDCKFLAHRALTDTALHLVNKCYGELIQSDTKYVSYNTSSFDYINYWITPDPSVLILTSSEATT